MDKIELTPELVESAQQYVKDWLDARIGWSEKPEWQYQDIYPIRQYVQTLGIPHAILEAYFYSENEFKTGHRCAVCARTQKQSDAIGYDCSNEC